MSGAQGGAREAETKRNIRRRVHQLADAADWMHLTVEQRRALYEKWSADPGVGGALGQVMQPTQVRVYLKDTLMKSYFRAKRTRLPELLSAMSLPLDGVTRRFTAPTAILTEGPRLYTLTPAIHWKIALMNTFERASSVAGLKRNLLLIERHTTGKFVDSAYRRMIEGVAQRLEIDIHWVT